MARRHYKTYEFLCESCKAEFSSLMESVDEDHSGNYVAVGVKCECGETCYPEGSVKPTDMNMVGDKDIRTGNWINKLPGDWKDFHNRVQKRTKSSISTMEKL